jgi:hypothetical protein
MLNGIITAKHQTFLRIKITFYWISTYHSHQQIETHKKSKKKAMGCEVLRISHCLDNWLTDVGKVVSPVHLKHYFSASGTHFC